MSTTNLTAKLKLVVQGQNKVNKMLKDIERTQKAVRDAGDQAGYFSKKIVQATDKLNRMSGATKEVANSAKKATKEYSTMERVISKIGNKLKWLASVYLGVMGMGALVRTSDTITSAQNRLNALEGGSPQQTKEVMDKVFAASQRARIGYTDMLANVSKTMTLAGSAFQDNIDNAIKFQEIMGKTYAMGGSSAAEQASSMYQLVQALGSGVLQGDELRSVREGAPLAYKAIEDFAKGVYATEESLKDLASQGKITSDLVVAAILGMENEVNKSFSHMKMTFTQAWTTIKNTAVKSFEPVFEMMNQALNSDFGKAVINGIGVALQVVAKALTIVFNLISKVYNFVVDNWTVISKVFLTLGTIIGGWLVYKMGLAIMTCSNLIKGFILAGVNAVRAAIMGAISWATLYPPLLIVIALLATIIIVLIWVSDSFRDACGIIVGSICWVGAIATNVFLFILNTFMGVTRSIVYLAADILTALNNTWRSATVAFWEWVQECLNGTDLVAKAVSKIAKAFGLDGVSIDAKIGAAKSKMGTYHSNEDYANAFNYFDYVSPSGWYDDGYGKGTGAYDWAINKLSGLTGGLALSGLDGSLGANSYDANKALGDLGKTADNTGKMANAMDLAEEDLEYLRKIADMEWKKEFTTAEIKVDMSNYNTLNGDSDLDGIVTKLADKLYEELDMVANGVYA